MTTTLDDYEAALGMRDAIIDISAKQIELDRPSPFYGNVTALDLANRLVTVQPIGDVGTQKVRCGSVMPFAVGQVVKVEGRLGDKWVSQVLGGAVLANTSGALATFGVDDQNRNDGTAPNVSSVTGAGLNFGASFSGLTGEHISSQRNAIYGGNQNGGQNQYGLDFWTNYIRRISVQNNGVSKIHGRLSNNVFGIAGVYPNSTLAGTASDWENYWIQCGTVVGTTDGNGWYTIGYRGPYSGGVAFGMAINGDVLNDAGWPAMKQGALGLSSMMILQLSSYTTTVVNKACRWHYLVVGY